MATKPASISARDLAAKVKDAVAAAATRHVKFKDAKPESGLALGPPWIWGFDLRDLHPEHTLKDVQEFAADVAKALPDGKTGKPAAFIHDGHITMGYIADVNVMLVKE